MPRRVDPSTATRTQSTPSNVRRVNPPGYRPGGKRRKRDDGASFGGFLANFGREAAGTITGLPAGVYELAKFVASTPGTAGAGERADENEELLRAIAKDYGYRYGPLFRGDFGTFGSRVYERPLSFGLDVLPATAATVKGATAARLIKPAPTTLSLRSPGAVAGREGAHVIERPLVGSELGRRMRVGIDRTLKKLPPEFAVLGETQRYARTLRIRELKDYTRLKLRAGPREAAKRGMSRNELVAANVLADFPLEADLDRLVAQLRSVEGAGPQVRLLTSKKVRNLYRHPSEKMLRYIDEENTLIGRMEDILPLSEAGAEQRRFLPALLVRGAKFEGDELVGPLREVEGFDYPEGTVFHGSPEGLISEVDPLRHTKPWEEGIGFYLTESQEKAQTYAKGRTATGERKTAAKESGAVSAYRIKGDAKILDLEAPADLGLWGQLATDLGFSKRDFDYYVVRQAGSKPSNRTIRDEFVIQLRDEFGPEAIYALEEAFWRSGIQATSHMEGLKSTPHRVWVVRDKDALEPVQGTSRRPQSRPIAEMIEEIRGELQTTGRPLPRYRPQKSVPEKSGVSMGAGGTAPQRQPLRQNKGVLQALGRVAYDIDTLQPQYMRTIKWASYTDRHADLMAAARSVDELPDGYQYVKRHLGERIGYTERTGAEFERRLAEAIDADDVDDLRMGPTRENELTTTNADDAAVDAQGRRLAVPERFAKTIVGEYQRSNAALRWLWEKPTDVWRAVVLNLRVGWLVNNLVGNTLLFMLKNAGPEGMKAYFRALADTRGVQAFLPMLKNRQVRKSLTPEDMVELFPEQVSGTFFGTQTPTTGVAGKLSRYSPTRPLREIDVAYEQAVRRAMATKLARKNPKVKARMKEMPKETRSFRQAARETLDQADVERISKQINDALGDFFSLGTNERGWIRRWVPFYAWYRAITGVTLKLPVDAPGRTLILANLGRVGEEASEDYGLPWLQGSIPLDDEGLLLGTRAANPFATVPDLGRGVFADDWFAARQRESVFNPIPELVAAAIREEGPLPRRLWEGILETGRGLPPTRLAFPEERESYEGDPRLREFLSYVGVPIRRVAPSKRRRTDLGR